MIEIHYIAILVSGIMSMILGALWYGPLFGKAWAKGMGWDDAAAREKMKKGAGPAYAQMFVLALVQAYVLFHVIWAFRTALPPMSNLLSGVNGGFFSWLGFILPVKYGDYLWAGKKMKYVSIDLGYYLVQLIIMGLIISFWH